MNENSYFEDPNSQENTQEKIKEKAVEILKRVQAEHPELRAVYLWGSIITHSFDPQTGDIDSIAIVHEDTDPELKNILNEELGKELPNLRINFLYPSSLNGGEPKTMLNFVSAESVLYDMQNWQHVAGEDFKKEDFELGKVELDEVIETTRLSVKKLLERRIEEDGSKYPIKGIAKLCSLIHQRRIPRKIFDYADLVSDSDEETREVCEKVTLIRNAGYPKELIKEHLPLFVSFLEKTDL